MNTKNLPILVGIFLPIVFILIISLVIFLPSLSIKPQYNFLYTGRNDYYNYDGGYKNNYKVENGKIALDPVPPLTDKNVIQKYKGDMAKIYLYDVKNNSSHEISFVEALKLNLDPGPSSPDGYTISYQYGHDGIFELFGSGDNTGWSIVKGRGKKTLIGLSSGSSYSRWYDGDLKFIGWVK
jgi:hypothetical protein